MLLRTQAEMTSLTLHQPEGKSPCGLFSAFSKDLRRDVSVVGIIYP
jgi:hypothetical protein